MIRSIHVGLLMALVLAGCMTSSKDYVLENTKGNFQVTGKVTAINGLTTTRWQDLSDGIAFVVGPPGCGVTIRQGEEEAATTRTFDLKEGDLIVHSHDLDHILSSIAVGSGGKADSGPKTDPPAKKDPPVKKDPPAKKEEVPTKEKKKETKKKEGDSD